MCRQQHNEPVNIQRVRELRIKIDNELRSGNSIFAQRSFNEQNIQNQAYAKT